MTPTMRYASVTFVLLAVMAGLIVIRIVTMEAGYDIRLRTKPMDIEQLEQFILGEEVEFEYRIARLDLTTLPGDNLFELRDTVYVKLGRLPHGEWVAQSTWVNPPQDLTGHEVVLKGEVVEREYLENIPPPVLITREITVRYGIERYAVPRGAFEELPAFGPLRRVTVDAAVNAAGRAAITGVRVGNEYYSEPVL